MHRVLPVFAAFLTLIPAAGAQDSKEVPDFARQVPKIHSGEPVFAFNGKDLTGFSTYLKENKHEDPLGVFTVVDGAIRVSGEEYGGFATKEEYGDYHLVVEWRWGEKTWPPRAGASLAIRASWFTVSDLMARRAGCGWSRSSARSLRGAAETSSWWAAWAGRSFRARFGRVRRTVNCIMRRAERR